MKAKAKRLDNGEWITASPLEEDGKVHSLVYVEKDESTGFTDIQEIEIDPSTLCEQVRGKNFFEGDEVHDGISPGLITWHENGWVVMVDDELIIFHSLTDDWTLTGTNKHD